MALYVLDENHTPVLCRDPHEWERFMKTDGRRVAETTIGGVWVSTVFLGLDHGWRNGPRWFETMAFRGKTDEGVGTPLDYGDRYETWEEALLGHEAICSQVRLALN